MPRSMCHPDYVYTPWSQRRRERASLLSRKRLGIPDGHVRIYGVHTPEKHGAILRPYAAEVARLRGYAAAHAFMIAAMAAGWGPEMPRLTIKKQGTDWALVEALIGEHMTAEEIANFCGIKLWYYKEKLRIFKRIADKRVKHDCQ